MVYIVKSNQSSENYDNWVCGGALISEWQVLTAASCLTEMSHVYVIAGYRKYVNGRGIEVDACTRARKNRVVKTCVPKSYNLTHEDQSKWMALDIGVATVEKPYNFSDKSWHRQCSYVPQAIRISYEEWLTYKDTDVVAFGWGGTHWRTATDVLDNNSRYLNEIAGIIVIKSVCKEAFDAQEVHNVIQKYMLCVAEGGNLNGDGTLRDVGPKTRTGCRRSGNYSGCKSDIVSDNTPVEKQAVPSRRQALCQNDHGGPLVTWRGSEEVLIGVACSSIVDVNTLACRPPSLFTSVYCTGAIVACLIARTKQARRACSEKIKTDGLHIQESEVNWGGLDEDYFDLK